MAETNNFKGVVGLTQAQFDLLKANGTIDVGGVTYTYDLSGTMYVTDSESVTIDGVTITKDDEEQIQAIAITDGADVKLAKDIAVTNKENTFTTKQIFSVDNGIAVQLYSSGGRGGLGIDNYEAYLTNNFKVRNVNNNTDLLYLCKDSSLTPIPDNQIDLGKSLTRFKDLYLSNNLSDGTNSATISQIVEALTIERLGE
jgi:hypothetical protein